MSEPLQVAVVGATGYAGFELARLLLRHPNVRKPTFYLRGTHADVRCLTELYPQLRGLGDAPCKPLSVDAIAKSEADVVFLSTPHEASQELVPALLSRKSGFAAGGSQWCISFPRWRNIGALVQTEAIRLWRADRVGLWSSRVICRCASGSSVSREPRLLCDFVILGLRPLVEAGWINLSRGIVCDCKSGVSGAGKEPKRETHFVEVNENFRAYRVHSPSAHARNRGARGTGIERFCIHDAPATGRTRDSFNVICLAGWKPRNAGDIAALYRKFYASRPMVRILPSGQLPELQHVTHTNFCDLGFALDPSGERLVIVSCLDNLGKGAAGQAVQNMNGMWGFPETAGLL